MYVACTQRNLCRPVRPAGTRARSLPLSLPRPAAAANTRAHAHGYMAARRLCMQRTGSGHAAEPEKTGHVLVHRMPCDKAPEWCMHAWRRTEAAGRSGSGRGRPCVCTRMSGGPGGTSAEGNKSAAHTNAPLPLAPTLVIFELHARRRCSPSPGRCACPAARPAAVRAGREEEIDDGAMHPRHMRSCMESSIIGWPGRPGWLARTRRPELEQRTNVKAGRLVWPGAGGRAAGACMSAYACCAAGRGRGGVCSADSRLWPPALCGWQALGVHWARARQRRSAAQSRRPSDRHMMHLPGGGRGGQAAPCRLGRICCCLLVATKDGPTVPVT